MQLSERQLVTPGESKQSFEGRKVFRQGTERCFQDSTGTVDKGNPQDLEGTDKQEDSRGRSAGERYKNHMGHMGRILTSVEAFSL